MKLVKSIQAEDIQRYLWYHSKLVPIYNEVVPVIITAADLKTLYGANKQFLNCTIPEVWANSYNRILGKKHEKYRADFIATTDNLYYTHTTLQGDKVLRVIESEWLQYEQAYDLSTFNYIVIDDNPSYWPPEP